MAAFATVEQLVSRWRPLNSEETARATVLLGDASAQIRAECPGIDARIVAVPPASVPLLDPVIPERVVCDMVKRAMTSDLNGVGVETVQEGAGPFQHSLKFSNPMGDMYLTKQERNLLGCGGQVAFMINVAPPREDLYPWLV